MFGFSQPGFSGTESGVVNAQVTITNGIPVPEGTTIVVDCIPFAIAGGAFAARELHACCCGHVAVVLAMLLLL